MTSQVGALIPTLIECAIVLANQNVLPRSWNEDIFRFLTGSVVHPTVANTLSPALLAGTAIAVAGISLRTAAFRTMGKQFTFELSIKKDHTLVTDFPYSVIRHPSYSAILVSFTGLGLTLSSSDGWMRSVFVPWITDSYMSSTKTASIIGTAIIFASYGLITAMVFSRVKAEDAMLRRQFGRQWDDWAQRVPYKIVPFVW
jgi:protein-S-isoprenylcysteine O-methyltransferase Ste14